MIDNSPEKLSQANQVFIEKINNKNHVSSPILQKYISEKDSYTPSKKNEKKDRKGLIAAGIVAGIGAIAAGVVMAFKGKAQKGIIELESLGIEGFKKLKADNFTGKVQGSLPNGDKLVMEYVNGILKKSQRTGIENIEKYYENIDGKKIVHNNINGKFSYSNLTAIRKKVETDQVKLNNILQDESLTSKEIEELSKDIKFKSEKQKAQIQQIIDDKKVKEAESTKIKLDKTKQTGLTDKLKTKFDLSGILGPGFEKVLATADFDQYGKAGLPLKYSLYAMEMKLQEILNTCSAKEAEEIKQAFNLHFTDSMFKKSLTDIPKLNVEIKSPKYQEIADVLREYTTQNEVFIADPVLKSGIEELIRDIPEFAFIIGKQQNSMHKFSLDIHTLKNLQKALKYAQEKGISPEDKQILKISVLLHDIGKKYYGLMSSDTGHAKLSKQYAEKMLENFKASKEQKDKILKLIENHHWFKEFNNGNMTAQQVVNLFGEDLDIAKIMAMSDLETVSDKFHLDTLSSGKKLTPSEYKELIQKKMDSISPDKTSSVVSSFVSFPLPSGKLTAYKEYEAPIGTKDIALKLGTGSTQIAFDNPELVKLCDELQEGDSFAIGCKNSTYPDVKIKIGDYYTDKVHNHHVVVSKKNGKIYISPHGNYPTIVVKNIPTTTNPNPTIASFIDKLRKKAGVVSETRTFTVGGQNLDFEVLLNSKTSGSNVGYYVIEKSTGDLYYAKEAMGSDQLKAELAAINLYKKAGIQVPEVSGFECGDTSSGIISKFVPELVDLTPSDYAEAGKGFGMDVLLANWDAVGLEYDNIQKSGKGIFRIDAGGSFDYHAHQGGNKPFGSIPTELLTMLDSGINQQTSKVFSNMSRNELIESLKKASALKEEDIIQCLKSAGCSKYTDTVLQRQKFIAQVITQMEKTPQGNMSSFEYMQKAIDEVLSEYIENAESPKQLQEVFNSLQYVKDVHTKEKLLDLCNQKQEYLKSIAPKIIQLAKSDVVDILETNGWTKINGSYSIKLSEAEKHQIYASYGSYAQEVVRRTQQPLSADDIEKMETMLNSCNGEFIELAKKDMKRFIRLFNCIKKEKVGIFTKGSNIVNPKMTEGKWRLIFNILSADEITADQIESLLSYKASSGLINSSLTKIKKGKKQFSDLDSTLQKEINSIQSYISSQVLLEDTVLYRGEGYEVLDSAILPNGKKLSDAMKEAAAKGKDAVTELRMMIMNNSVKASQERFMSTSLLDGHEFSGSQIIWELHVQKGSKGVMLEGINVDGSLKGECEVLLQKDSIITIDDIKYIGGRWHCKGTVIN